MCVQNNNDIIWEKCLGLCHEYIQKSIEKRASEEEIAQSRIEYALQSKHIPRGFYCPSPDLEYIITNMRRGKLSQNPAKTFKPTNRYTFDTNGRLRIAETFYSENCAKKEILHYEKNIVYGATFDSNGQLSEISIEEYDGKQIKTYLWASCLYQRAKERYTVLQMIYEVYNYTTEGMLATDFFNMSGIQSSLSQHQHYQFQLKTKDREADLLSPPKQTK